MWPKIWPDMSKAAQKIEKRGIYFIDPEAGEYKESIFKKRKEKVGDTDGGGNALQHGNKAALK